MFVNTGRLTNHCEKPTYLLINTKVLHARDAEAEYAMHYCFLRHASIFSARCNVYISRLCYDVSVLLSVRLSVCDVCTLWSQGAMDPGYLCMLG